MSEHSNIHLPAFIIKMGKDAFKDGLSPKENPYLNGNIKENPYLNGNISNYLIWQEGWDIACKQDMEDAVEASENISEGNPYEYGSINYNRWEEGIKPLSYYLEENKEWDWLESEAAEADEARDRAKKIKLEMTCPDCKHTLYLTIEGE